MPGEGMVGRNCRALQMDMMKKKGGGKQFRVVTKLSLKWRDMKSKLSKKEAKKDLGHGDWDMTGTWGRHPWRPLPTGKNVEYLGWVKVRW